ncbi:putative metalloprotease CJM1_0395 family protein [Marinobacter sp. 1_MG-2023]|uniref:putative metalloprotease CJM1_0395 family protein n=1 Tax=Marinobacter sp. 1_MG-2023 TaxID=3062627 RepID=UPI0026E1E66A|nr:putative metalloprotease CJM1_0395 family protein [Marinobacter sp. 1_MG-2023]MDO6823213.1 putative metalloprotease CJM1_0395 family protein [Marinobacter sp. 1_MG-2023]
MSSEAPAEPGNRAVRAADESEAAGTKRKAGEPSASDKEVGGLNEAELKELSELKARDREVRAHEAAHQAVGGQYAGSMSFTYQRGADGAQYAVGGEVSIDVSPVNGDPQATIEKMRVVRAAAMAPAEPSGQDRAVAAQAMQTMLQAQSELASEQGSSDSEGEVSARVDDGVSSDSRDSSSASESSAEQLSRASQQARSIYQDIAGFVPDPTSGKDGFLPISV